MAAEKKTRGPRKKTNPPVLWPVPTPEGLSDLRREVRQIAEQQQFQCHRQVFEKVGDVIELLLLLTQPKPDRAEIDRVRRYFFEMAARDAKTPEETFKSVVEKLKGTAFALGYARIRQLYYSEWPRRDGVPSDN